MTASKFEQRKQEILETMRRLNQPVWPGDLTNDKIELVSYGKAFRALADEGKIKKRPGAKNSRVYYYLAAPSEQTFCANST